MPGPFARRRLVAGLGGVLTVGLAGCGDPEGPGYPTDPDDPSEDVVDEGRENDGGNDSDELESR